MSKNRHFLFKVKIKYLNFLNIFYNFKFKKMIYLLIPVLIFIDLYSKFLAKIANIDLKILGDFIYLKYIENIWVAFSIWITWNILKIISFYNKK